MESETLEIHHGVGIIGLGAVGRRFVEQFGLHNSFRVEAVWDLSTAACQSAATDFDVFVAESAADVVGLDAVDLVYIAVPPLFHEQYVDMVVAAGKTVFCEKPLGVDGPASSAMVDRVAASGVNAAVNFVFGSAPGAAELGRLIDDGAAGNIVGAELRLHFAEWPRPFQADALWLRDRDQGGWVREVVSHFVFLADRIFGPGVVTNCSVVYPDDGTSEQAVSAAVTFGDTQLTIAASSDACGPDEVEFIVWGSARSFRLSDWYRLRSSDGGQWEDVLPQDAIGGPAAYAAQLGQVANLVGGEAHTLATFEAGLRVQELVESLLDTPA